MNRPDINRQQIYWDKLAATAQFTHPLNIEIIRNFIVPHMRVLDYGCGYGRICQELWQNGYINVFGVDISPRMIEKGKQLFPGLNLQILDDYRLWNGDIHFDAVILFSVLTCIPENRAIQNLIDHIHDILIPGGCLYISDTLIQTDEKNVQRYMQFAADFGTYGVFRLPEGGVFRHFEMNDIHAFTHRFKDILTKFIDVLTMHNHPVRGFQYLCQKYNPEDCTIMK